VEDNSQQTPLKRSFVLDLSTARFAFPYAICNTKGSVDKWLGYAWVVVSKPRAEAHRIDHQNHGKLAIFHLGRNNNLTKTTMNKKERSIINKRNAQMRWGDRFQIFARLSKYVEQGNFWDELQKWPTTYLSKLLKHYDTKLR
jgi:hypothetical protein